MITAIFEPTLKTECSKVAEKYESKITVQRKCCIFSQNRLYVFSILALPVPFWVQSANSVKNKQNGNSVHASICSTGCWYHRFSLTELVPAWVTCRIIHPGSLPLRWAAFLTRCLCRLSTFDSGRNRAGSWFPLRLISVDRWPTAEGQNRAHTNTATPWDAWKIVHLRANFITE